MTDVASDKKNGGDVRIVAGRSPAYPYIDLEKAVRKAEAVRDAGAARTVLPPETVYKIWGLGAQSSGSRQTLAALNHFGLVDYIGRGDDRKIKLSDLALKIVLDRQPDSVDRTAAVRLAALEPAIHAELYEKFGALLPADVVMETYLVRDRGYNEPAASALLSEYRSSLAYAGLDKPSSMPAPIASSQVVEPPSKPLQAISIGDRVQVEIGGVNQLARPAKVRAIQAHDGQDWVFVEGSETGIPMHQAQLIEKASVPGQPSSPAPKLSEAKAVDASSISPGEHEWLRGPLSKEVKYKLIVSGEMGPREISKLIKVLEAQKAVLEDENGE